RRAPGAARRLDLDGLAELVAEQRGAEGGGRRDGSAAADGADLDPERLAVLVLDLDDGADPDLVATRIVDDLCVVEPCAKRADARLEHALLVLRRVVLEVLGEIAELARLLDRGHDFGAARPREVGELVAYGFGLLPRLPLLGHGLSSPTRCSPGPHRGTRAPSYSP